MTTPMGPWPLGIDNVSGAGALPRDQNGRQVALVDAANVDIDRGGRPSRRGGARLVQAGNGLHSLWSGGDHALVAIGAELCNARDLQPVATLNSADPCSYAELNGEVIVGNRTTLLRVAGGRAAVLGVPDAPPAAATASDAGGLTAGRYAVAVAFVSDQGEGGLSSLRFVDVPEGGGIIVDQLPTASDAVSLAIYRSQPNGEELYRAAQIPVGFPSYHVGAGGLDGAARTRNLRRMPPGEHVAAFNGYLLVAHGRTLRFSEPLRYGLHSPRHGFVQLPSRITMLAAVGNVVFVGTTAGVVLLRGPRPREWAMENTAGLPPIPGASALVRSGQVQSELAGRNAALWLAPNGFVLGTEEGVLVELQAERLAGLRYVSGALCVHGRRVTAAVA
ncbi:hypothetical protein [Stenotrophomonas maltophilia]|uniref:hypothetical protein n=1 Tax=Stenotrophomonas maltophilia TaxID=40324 RepID=UPI0021C8F4B0|nr:hypothetical protein [Stenotrophomonas maltophilia]MCU1145801.1 hypothetical protein [Stenotrophomonas maltophilia]